MMPFGVKPGLPTLKEYLDMFMKIFMDDFIVYSDIICRSSDHVLKSAKKWH